MVSIHKQDKTHQMASAKVLTEDSERAFARESINQLSCGYSRNKCGECVVPCCNINNVRRERFRSQHIIDAMDHAVVSFDINKGTMVIRDYHRVFIDTRRIKVDGDVFSIEGGDHHSIN